VHEIKFDGYRFQLHLNAGKVSFYTRRGHDWTNRVGTLRAAAGRLPADVAILDGEVIVQSADGRPDFHALEKELKREDGSDRLTFYAFDLLYIDGFDLRAAGLLDRKRELALLLNGVEGSIKFSEHVVGDGPALLRTCAGKTWKVSSHAGAEPEPAWPGQGPSPTGPF
jgi:bifunctional non-homologous end joining protein LigD